MKKIICLLFVFIFILPLITFTACNNDSLDNYVPQTVVPKVLSEEKQQEIKNYFSNTTFTATTLANAVIDNFNFWKDNGGDNSLYTIIKENSSIKSLIEDDSRTPSVANLIYSSSKKSNKEKLQLIKDFYKIFKRDDQIYLLAIKYTNQNIPFIYLFKDFYLKEFENVIKPKLKDPDSLQIHSAKVLLKRKENVSDIVSFSIHDITIEVDYSAKNGFGGMNRSYCYVYYSVTNNKLCWEGTSNSSFNIVQLALEKKTVYSYFLYLK